MNQGSPPLPSEAVVLAAGYGNRLRPLTLVRPKPLSPVLNRPVLSWVLKHLERFGISRVSANAHHLHECLERFAASGEWSMELSIVVESAILGTGGGIRNCASQLSRRNPILVMNGDLLADIDLHALVENHIRGGALATMALHDYPRFNIVAVEGDRVAGFQRKADDNFGNLPRMAFTGVHVIEPELLSRIPEGPSSIIDVYEELIHRGGAVQAHFCKGHYWKDVGSLKDYADVHAELLARAPDPFLVHESAAVSPDVRLENWACVGPDVRLGAGCRVARSILWDGVRVEEGVHIEDAVVTDGVVVSRNLLGEILTDGSCVEMFRSP